MPLINKKRSTEERAYPRYLRNPRFNNCGASVLTIDASQGLVNRECRLNDAFKEASQSIQEADALLITAGAGMGVDSGLPDFRGPEGFWRAYPAIAKLGLSFEEMANPVWFRRDPELAWAFYGHRLNLYRNTAPHAGFGQLLDVAHSRKFGYFVFTSNVDGHFQKAGYAPERVVECHGSIQHLQCTVPCCDEIWNGEQIVIDVDARSFRACKPLPKCPNCSAMARPNILMFGDWSWLDQRTTGQEQSFNRWLDQLVMSSAKLAVVELGAGTAIPTVRNISEAVCRKLGGRLVRINLREANVSQGHIGLSLGAAEGICQICEALNTLRKSPGSGPFNS